MVATPGRRLGRYHLVDPIGAGPCGEVYRAKVVGVAGMERQLAIKRFYPAVLAMPEAGPRLQQASRSYGALDHPRIARLSELGVAGGETFTATELVPGLDVGRLRSMAADTSEALPAGAVLALVSAAARAVGYAHGRGVCHWGLGPGNLIVTPDGDVKVTDFGILTCRLPARPSSDDSLIQRLPYLAPEQLLGEPLSAASDVFALGVLAHELVSGARPFTGATAAEIEHAIVSGRPVPLELPRPIVRVIDRCLARSPFERFPDARSLADGLDAALRLSPLAGTRKDLGDRVRVALEHLARIHEHQLSGALSFSVPQQPQPPTPPAVPSLRMTRQAPGAPPVPPPPMTTMTGAPPPPPALPPVPPRPYVAAPLPLTAPPSRTGMPPRPGRLRVETELSVGDETGRIEPLWPPTEPVPLVRPDGTPYDDVPRGPASLEALRARTAASFDQARGNPPPSFGAAAAGAADSSLGGSFDDARTAPLDHVVRPRSAGGSGAQPHVRAAAPSMPPSFTPPIAPAGPPPPPVSAPPLARPPVRPPFGAPPPPPMVVDVPRRGHGRTIAIVLGVAALAAGGAVAALTLLGKPAASAPDAGAVAIATTADAAGPVEMDPIDAATAGTVALAVDAGTPIDAGAPAAIDAAAAAPAADKLTITSDPPGAKVYVDGADRGPTPVELPASADQRAIAVYAPGRALHLATVPGSGTHEATLAPAPKHTGKGGIKVRCRVAKRYYVFIDGKPTGELCSPEPERIPAALGNHQIEVYDLLTGTRRSDSVRVKQIARSTRISMD